MSDIRAVVVPKELYYHEVAYVRGLEAEIERLRGALAGVVMDIDASAPGHAYVRARAALKDKP